jgi:hypothetical protein
VNGYVELREHALDAVLLGLFEKSDRRTLGCGQNHGTWNGEDRRQREDGRVVIVKGSRVLAVMLQDAVRRHVAVNQGLVVSMLVAFVHVLRRGERQQANRQAERARENPGNPHVGIVSDGGRSDNSGRAEN